MERIVIMIGKQSWLVMVGLSIVLVGGTIGAAHSQRPSADGTIDPTCTSSNPCIEYDNNGSGPGIRGVSIGGNGLAGSTEFKSTSSSNFREGLIGNDISTTGIWDAGVRGLSVRGNGVLGNSTSGPGVSGTSNTNAAVLGSSGSSSGVLGVSTSSYGVIGETLGSISNVAGIEGNNNGSTIAVRANGFGGPLFVGNNHNGLDVITMDDSGNLTANGNSQIGGNASVTGTSSVGGASTLSSDLTVGGHAGIDASPQSNSSLILGYSSTNDYGIQTIGNIFGVTAVGGAAGVQGAASNSTGTAVKAFGNAALLFEGVGSSLTDVFTVDNSGNVNAHGYSSSLAATSGRTMVTYAPQRVSLSSKTSAKPNSLTVQATFRLRVVLQASWLGA
jgi:hypothetical protein